MPVYHYPDGNRTYFEFIRYWRPQGSNTVLWAQEMRTGRMFYLLRWGNEIYLPVTPGDYLGIGIHNGS